MIQYSINNNNTNYIIYIYNYFIFTIKLCLRNITIINNIIIYLCLLVAESIINIEFFLGNSVNIK